MHPNLALEFGSESEFLDYIEEYSDEDYVDELKLIEFVDDGDEDYIEELDDDDYDAEAARIYK